jgi:hypothetical protein
MALVNHYFEPPRMTKTSRGNVAGCCDKPEVDHRPAVANTPLVIQLRRDVRHVHGRGDLGKGSVLNVRLHVGEALQEVRPSRWGTNVLGQFAELDKGEYQMVQSVGYTIPHAPNDYSMATVIPLKWAKEI